MFLMLSDEKNSLFIWNYMKMNQNHIFRGTDTKMLMGSMSLYESNMITKDNTAYLDKHKCHEGFIQNLLKHFPHSH